MTRKPISPKLMTATSRSISAETIFETVKTIIDAGLEEDFLAKCAGKRKMTIKRSDMNFIKKYLSDYHNNHLLESASTEMVDRVRVATDSAQC